jgi:purine-binding chemotaxis protein CheW
MSDLIPNTNMAAKLRAAFDRTYATPALSRETSQSEDLLAIRLAGNAYAVKVNEISGLAKERKIISLPSAIPELLGVAGIRGELVPVYSLATLMGVNRGSEEDRWLVLCGVDEPIGLAFPEFEGYLQVPFAHLYAASQENMTSGHIKEVVRTADLIRSVLSIPSIVEMIRRRCGRDRTSPNSLNK